MDDSIFTPAGGGRFEPTKHARGPWDRGALHGGAPAALIARAFERTQPGAELPVARLAFEFLKPIPFAKLGVETEIVRRGRRVQELAAELRAGEELVCRASALRIQPVPEGLPSSGPQPAEQLPGPERGKVTRFALNRDAGTSLATTGMEMSWLDDPWALGPGRVWMRPRQPILPGEEASPLVRLVATADFGNGVSAELPFDEYLFINADLTIHLWRRPRGEWIGLDARTLLSEGGTGTTESVLHDTNGAVGRAFQTLVVQPR
ncbi:MAG TPA: thioesterase family protein [Solirubrobacteraceae bacterium]|nr:thioesterase family protein [Solirubrobacteraceae bacterium]